MYIFMITSATAFLAYFGALLMRAPERDDEDKISFSAPPLPNWPSGSQAFSSWVRSTFPSRVTTAWIDAQEKFTAWHLWHEAQRRNSDISLLSKVIYNTKMALLASKESFLNESTIHEIQSYTYKKYIKEKVGHAFALMEPTEENKTLQEKFKKLIDVDILEKLRSREWPGVAELETTFAENAELRESVAWRLLIASEEQSEIEVKL